MGKFYKSTPWLIPSAPVEIQALFKSFGEKLSVKRGQVVCGKAFEDTFCSLNDLVYIDTGLLAQVYLTHKTNKPNAISLALAGRVLNYASYLGFNNDGENLIAKKKSTLFSLKRAKFDELVAAEPPLQEAMLKYCISCVASDYDAFTCMFTCDVEECIIYFFQSLINTFSSPCEDGWFYIPIKLSYRDISEVVYSSTKMIERIIPSWIQGGYIEPHRTALKVHQSLFK